MSVEKVKLLAHQIIEQVSKLETDVERENRGLRIRLSAYEEDATALIEKYGGDPDDKIDREVLKQMLNSSLGKNRRLKELLKDVANRWKGSRAYIEQALQDK